MAGPGPSTQTVNVYIRNIVVHHDRDPGPGRGEYDVTFVGAASPVSAAPEARSGARWTGSVASGSSYTVGLWTGPVGVPSSHSLAVVGAGEERDALVADALRGGLALFGRDHDWGAGRWWRTTNGQHFDFVFYVARMEAGVTSQEISAPVWTSDSADAPGPAQPTPDEYAVAFGAPPRDE
jgi:hypothetical protein